MRFFLFVVALLSFSTSNTVHSTVSNLNGDFPFVEGNHLFAKINTELGQIDNFLRSKEAKQESSFFKLSPQLFMQTQGSGSLFQLQANADYISFDQFSADDHYDFSILSKFHLRFAESQKIFMSAFIANDHEYRGTGLSLGTANSLSEGDTKRNSFVNFGYLYGHQDSQARARFLLGYRDFSYLTRKEITKQLAYSSNYFQGNVDYLITGKTYFSTKLQYENLSYDNNDDLERQQYLALAGIKWESTELTQLSLLLGYEKANFVKETLKSEDHFAWQVKLLWNPLQRLRLDFSSGSDIKESYKIDKSISFSNYYALGLAYDFTDQLIFTVNSKSVHEDIVGEINNFKEEYFEMDLGIDYLWRHWLTIYAKYHYKTFDSAKLMYDYDLQKFYVGVVVTL